MARKAYNRQKAVEYAHKWAFSRNPAYYNFDSIGGDCTNFISQCLYAGSNVMNYTKTFGWYYISGNDKSPSWTSVVYLYNFLTTNKSRGPYGKKVSIEQIKIGDVIQLSFDGASFSHSLIVVQNGLTPNIDNILVASHTIDRDYFHLKDFYFKSLRCINIEGVLI